MIRSRPVDAAQHVRESVRQGYGRIAQSGGSCCTTPACCGSAPAQNKKLAKTVGYSEQELKALPEGANMGLSCGNPTALASLKPGEVVLDLGSGGGFDVFIAGPRVGAKGRVIGVDMTPEMLAKARRNVAAYRNPKSAIRNPQSDGFPFTSPAAAAAWRRLGTK